MGRLFAQAYPHLVLFCPFAAEESEDGDHNEDEHHAELHVGPPGEAPEDEAVGIADLHVVGVAEVDADDSACVFHGQSLAQDGGLDRGV